MMWDLNTQHLSISCAVFTFCIYCRFPSLCVSDVVSLKHGSTNTSERESEKQLYCLYSTSDSPHCWHSFCISPSVFFTDAIIILWLPLSQHSQIGQTAPREYRAFTLTHFRCFYPSTVHYSDIFNQYVCSLGIKPLTFVLLMQLNQLSYRSTVEHNRYHKSLTKCLNFNA